MNAPSNLKLFRGETAARLVDELVLLYGWPEPAARSVARWLTDRNEIPPDWQELMGGKSISPA